MVLNAREEVWKDIQGYEGLYKVSNKGRILSSQTDSKKSTVRKLGWNTKGYQTVNLSKNGKIKTLMVHRIVANAFIDNPLGKKQVNHIDGNKKNNCVENLEWCTNGENQTHAYRIGLKGTTKNGFQKLRM